MSDRSDAEAQVGRRLLGAGKAPTDLLAAVSGPLADHRVVQGPGIGCDAAIVEQGDRALVVTSDPITFVDADAGKLAVTVNANDVFAVGAEPEWMLATVLAPVGAPVDEVRALLEELQEACRSADISLIGGHTEATDAVTRAVVSCTMIGVAPMERIVRSDGALDGDAIIQAGAAAVEGTAILGRPELLDAPGISIATAARALREVDGVHAMHDVTEGGLATAALELAEAAGLAPTLVFEDILWLPETLAVCAERGLDPVGLLGSGTLLAAVSTESVEWALAGLARVDVKASVIGRVGLGIRATLSHVGQTRPLPRFERDEALRGLAERDTPLPPEEGVTEG